MLLVPYMLLTPILMAYYFILWSIPFVIIAATALSPVIVIILLMEIRQKIAKQPAYNVYSYNTIESEGTR